MLLKEFLADYDMKFLSKADDMKYCVPYTFSNAKRNCSSIIDFICFSSGLLPHVSAYCSIEDGVNLSDHEPLNLRLIIPTMNLALLCLLVERGSLLIMLIMDNNVRV